MKHLPLLALVGAVTFLGTTAGTFAQTAQPPAPAKTEKAPELMRTIKIKNVPSALIAYWLDPKHNARPAALGEVNSNRYGAPREAEEKGAFTLPGDIRQVVSVDPQNVILVAGGSKEDMNRLEELIDVLDQPLRQVEIAAQFVEMNTADVSQFGIDTNVAGKGDIGFVRSNFNAQLNKLIGEGRAKVVSAPRVTAINNVPATINAATPPTNGKTPKWVYNLTPTINGDDTITILFQPVAEKGGIETVANVRDGDTITMIVQATPQTTDAINALPALKTTLVFLTTRIIWRAGEKLSVAGK